MSNEQLDLLYRKHYRDLFLYIYSLCRDKAITEDLVSETFVRALISFDGDDSFFKYGAFRVGKNLWLSSLRRSKK